LFGIALDYGVTVDGLLRVNGLNEEDFLRIGQSLVIPLEEEEAGTEAQVPMGNVILPTPTPLPLTTSGVTLYQTPVGGLWCMGEVVNTTEGPITNLQVEVVLVAVDGTPLARGRALAAADYLAPQQRAPFSVLFQEPPEGVTDADVRLLRGEPVSAITASFVPLGVVDVEGSVSGPQYRVRGEVLNTSEQSVSRVAVVATIYNAEDNVVGYRQILMPEDVNLAPGQQYAFELLITPQEVVPPTGFEVVAWGNIS
jgi:LysM repeat protein